VDPVSDGQRPLPVTDVQLFGILTTHRLWMLRLQPRMINVSKNIHLYENYVFSHVMPPSSEENYPEYGGSR
jgi:hypothetical protein